MSLGKRARQVRGQVIPRGLLETFPFPVIVTNTSRVIRVVDLPVDTEAEATTNAAASTNTMRLLVTTHARIALE